MTQDREEKNILLFKNQNKIEAKTIISKRGKNLEQNNRQIKKLQISKL